MITLFFVQLYAVNLKIQILFSDKLSQMIQGNCWHGVPLLHCCLQFGEYLTWIKTKAPSWHWTLVIMASHHASGPRAHSKVMQWVVVCCRSNITGRSVSWRGSFYGQSLASKTGDQFQKQTLSNAHKHILPVHKQTLLPLYFIDHDPYKLQQSTLFAYFTAISPRWSHILWSFIARQLHILCSNAGFIHLAAGPASWHIHHWCVII